jgi:hypothetical protein
MKAYTTWGPVRGCCNHAHQTPGTAMKCLAQDRRGCKKQGGYSDRQVRRISTMRDLRFFDVQNGPGERLDEEELD